MSRMDYMLAVGQTDYPPTEVMWEELQRDIEALDLQGPPGMTAREMLGSVPAKHAIFEWKRRHKLLPPEWQPGP